LISSISFSNHGGQAAIARAGRPVHAALALCHPLEMIVDNNPAQYGRLVRKGITSARSPDPYSWATSSDY
jgi:hypothetical protein